MLFNSMDGPTLEMLEMCVCVISYTISETGYQ